MMPMLMRSSHFAAAYVLDLCAGDPESLPHPVRMIGAAISAGENRLRVQATPPEEILRGGLLTAAIVGGSWATARLAVRAGALAEVLIGWTALATRSLLDESSAVLDALDREDLPLARSRLARIVGRDTDRLEESEIARAVVETLAESLCDGVIAPMLCLAIGGAPLAIAFKAVNTLDSMIGHREPPYLYFGRIAARLDDAAAFLPARTAALAIAAGAALTGHNASRALSVWMRDGHRHPSPNAGRPEAAIAGALGVRLGGVNYYDGEPAPKPVLGSEGRPAERRDVRAAMCIVTAASAVAFACIWVCLRWKEGRS
jgi:adenosylcobinamide-phosphate synthase